MSKKEEAIKHLYSTIKTKFEEDGILQEVRCLLQSKMIAMMRGVNEKNCLAPRQLICGANNIPDDSRLTLLNQLIMEYLHWHNLRYTAEMLAVESGCDSKNPPRDLLENVVGSYPHKNVPILLHIVAELMYERKQ